MAEEIKEQMDQKHQKLSVENNEFQALLSELPREKHLMVKNSSLYYHQGFWSSDLLFRGQVAAQRNFIALDDDIILTSSPKSGATWMKSLIYSVVNRSQFHPKEDFPLSKMSPHDLVPTLELYPSSTWFLDLGGLPRPRIFSTHTPYSSLATSITSSKCKIVYVSRNPMDQFVSLWHFGSKIRDDKDEPRDLEECFDHFCRGIHMCGPFWNHVLEFWKASIETPDKVLFLKYEDLKKDTTANVKRLARFLGFPFSVEEVEQGLVDEIAMFCSFENLKSLDPNKNGKLPEYGIPLTAFFRKGEVGDSKNFLTEAMIRRLEKIMQKEYKDYNLTYDLPI